MKPTEREAAKSFRPWRGRTFLGSTPTGLDGRVGFALRRLKPAATHGWPLPGPAAVPSMLFLGNRFSHYGPPFSAMNTQNDSMADECMDVTLSSVVNPFKAKHLRAHAGFGTPAGSTPFLFSFGKM